MISRRLADQLGLQAIGSNTGRDANGREITTEIAVFNRLSIGSVTFRSVQVLIHDFRTVDPNGCFIDAGVIGSEILPGSAWRINADTQTLEIAAAADLLSEPDAPDPPIVARLHDFGYPHAPVFNYSIGTLEDRGLFDTGNSDTITLFERVARDDRARRAMISASAREGRGTHGVSAGGVGAYGDLLRFEIEGIRLDDVALGRLSGTTRSVPPTLIGLGVLATHNVTLDYPNGRLVFRRNARNVPDLPHPGYSLMASDDGVRVAQLYRGSFAETAGVQLNDLVIAIDGRGIVSGGAPCDLTRWLTESSPTYSARTLTVQRGDRTIRLNLTTD